MTIAPGLLSELRRASIAIEGDLDRPVIQALRRTHLLVLAREENTGNPGAAIGGEVLWNVVCSLPRAQFADLLAIVLADRLVKVDLLFEELRRVKAILRSVHFRTAPVPADAEIEEDETDADGATE